MPQQGMGSWVKAITFSKVKKKALRLVGKKPGQRSPRTDSEEEQFADLESNRVDVLSDQHSINRAGAGPQTDSLKQDEVAARHDYSPEIMVRSGSAVRPAHSMRKQLETANRDDKAYRHRDDKSFRKLSSFSSTSSLGAKSTLSSAASSACTIPSEQTLRNAFASDKTLVTLDDVQQELKELKRVMKDVKRFQKAPDLQRSLVVLAGKKKAAIQQKLESIEFYGEEEDEYDTDDEIAFIKRKDAIKRALDRFTVGLDKVSEPPVLNSEHLVLRTVHSEDIDGSEPAMINVKVERGAPEPSNNSETSVSAVPPRPPRTSSVGTMRRVALKTPEGDDARLRSLAVPHPPRVPRALPRIRRPTKATVPHPRDPAAAVHEHHSDDSTSPIHVMVEP